MKADFAKSGSNGRGRPGSQGAAKGADVQSLARALSILDTISRSHEGLTLTVLSKAVTLPPSTTHRLLTTLQRRRFVRFDPTTMFWQIGVEAFFVGNAFARTRDLVAIARPYMRRLMEESGETANLYMLNEGEVTCMAQVESRQMMRAISRPGGRVGLHFSGAGKAILAYLPQTDVDRIAALHGLPRATAKTLVTLKKLKAELRAIRSRGFAIDDEEHAVGLRCVGAPILDERGAPIAALSLSGPVARVTDDRLNALGAIVVEACRATTIEIGGRIAGDRQHVISDARH
jgi:IclR family acetate operon transcriptional repressor